MSTRRFDAPTDELNEGNKAHKNGKLVNQTNTTPVNYDEHPCCAYCLENDIQTLAKCPETGKYFCNGGTKNKMSHIVYHLSKSKEHTFILPDKNQYSKSNFSCYFCEKKNLFSLVFACNKKNNLFYVVCRNCITSQKSLEYEFDQENRLQIINDDVVSDFIIKIPKETKGIGKITYRDMDVLENIWKDDPNASVLDLAEHLQAEDTEKTRLVYTNYAQYSEIFLPLIDYELQEDFTRTKLSEIRNGTLRWEKIGYRRYHAIYQYSVDDPNPRMSVQTKVVATNPSLPGFEVRGIVVNAVPFNTITIMFSSPVDINSEMKNWTIIPEFDDTAYNRQSRAVKKLNGNDIPQSLKQILLGYLSSISNYNLSIPPIPQVNSSQQDAIQASLSHNFSIIQGPPGTGKTHTLVSICRYLLSSHKKRPKILVAAPSNTAVFNVHNMLCQAQLQSVLFLSQTQEELIMYDAPNRVDVLARRLNPELISFDAIKLERELTKEEFDRFKIMRNAAYSRIIQSAEIVCCTCNTSGSDIIANEVFDKVIIDEATQCTEPDSLIALSHGANQVILIGDQCQLGPVILSSRAARLGLSVSLMERLIEVGVVPSVLKVQYRMHPELAVFPSSMFYDGCLLNGIDASKRTYSKEVFPWPKAGVPMLFYNYQKGEEERSESTVSFFNRYEASIVLNIIKILLSNGVSGKEIGVITPYQGQTNYLSMMLGCDNSAKDVIVSSVDRFQGSEKDFIIISCVRKNRSHSIGFLKDRRRLNVALTRARCGLFVIGYATGLCHNQMWESFVKHCMKRGVFVEGDLNNLMVSLTNLEDRVIKRNQKASTRGVRKGRRGANMVPEAPDVEDAIGEGEEYFVT